MSYSQLVDQQEAAANEENEINDDLYKFRALIGHQGPLKATYPNWQGCKYSVLVEWETGEKTYEPLSVLAEDDPVTCATYFKENDFLHNDGWKMFRHIAKRDKHDLFGLASLKGEMKSSFSWTSLFKRVPHQALYVMVTLHLESSIKSSCCVVPYQALYVTLILQSSIKSSCFASSSTFLFVTLLFTLELLSLCQDILLKPTEFPTATPT